MLSIIMKIGHSTKLIPYFINHCKC